MHQDNDLKHNRKYTTEWLKKKQINMMPNEWPRLIHEWNVQWDLKRALHKQMSTKLDELKQHDPKSFLKKNSYQTGKINICVWQCDGVELRSILQDVNAHPQRLLPEFRSGEDRTEGTCDKCRLKNRMSTHILNSAAQPKVV